MHIRVMQPGLWLLSTCYLTFIPARSAILTFQEGRSLMHDSQGDMQRGEGWRPHIAPPGLNVEASSPGRQARAVCGTLMGRGVCGGSREPGRPASSVSGRLDEKLRSMPLTVLSDAWFIISLADRCMSCTCRVGNERVPCCLHAFESILTA